MANIITLCEIAGLLLLWAIFSALLVPLSIVVWLLKGLLRGIEWARNKATGEA